MNHEDKVEGAIDRLVKLWPIGVLIFAIVTGYIKLQFDVTDLKHGQDKWQQGSESRREKSHEEIDDIKNRLTRVETKLDYLMEVRQ